MLEIANLRKEFVKKDRQTKQTRVVGVHNFSFEAKPGRIFGLIGANGAGKTTAMRIIANLTHPQFGEILLNNKKYSEIKNLKRKLGFVSGETQVFDRLTPYETIWLFGEMAGVPRTELDENIRHLASKLDMLDFLHLPAGQFSTGMKQKVSIARALITEPDVLIFDEVTNGLDIFAARAVKEIVKELRDQGKIVLFSTHIMPDADELCDDLALVHDGNMMDTGSKEQLFKKHGVKSTYDLFFKLVGPENFKI